MRKLLGMVVVSSALLVPTQAGATIAFARYPSISAEPNVWVMDDIGSTKTKLSKGNTPVISPDGSTVAFIKAKNTRTTYSESLYIASSSGGSVRLLLKNVGYGTIAWSPDSKKLLAAAGTSNIYGTGSTKLVLIDVATGAVLTVQKTKGLVQGPSFSPDGSQIVFGKTTSQTAYNAPADIYVASISNGAISGVKKITSDGCSSFPLWGPQKIVFVRFRNRKNNAPVFNLFTMNADGSGVSKLTSMKARNLVSGLTPVAWSADGTKLAANYVGQDTNQAYAVDVTNGQVRDLGQTKFDGTSAFGISQDGQKVLVATLAFEPSTKGSVATVPFVGGPLTTLSKNATQPSWTGLLVSPKPLPL